MRKACVGRGFNVSLVQTQETWETRSKDSYASTNVIIHIGQCPFHRIDLLRRCAVDLSHNRQFNLFLYVATVIIVRHLPGAGSAVIN